MINVTEILVSTKDLSREDWLKFRNKGIGGSDVAAICGLNKYKSPVEIWMEKAGKIEPKQAGEAAYWGTIMEPIIRDEFTLRTNLQVKIVKAILKHPKYDYMLANVDGIINDPLAGDCIFEAKTASIFKQDEWQGDKIPEAYMLQIQHYMAVTGYNRTFIAVLLGGNQFKYKMIERDDELIDMIIKLEADFWEHVINNMPPEMDGSEASSELLNRLFPNSQNEKQIILPDEAKALMTQYDIAKANEKKYAEIKEEAANKLKFMLGDNETGIIDDKVITWKSISSTKFDSKKLQQEMPDIYNKYLIKSNYKKFSVK